LCSFDLIDKGYPVLQKKVKITKHHCFAQRNIVSQQASTPPGMPGTYPHQFLVGVDINGNVPTNIRGGNVYVVE